MQSIRRTGGRMGVVARRKKNGRRRSGSRHKAPRRQKPIVTVRDSSATATADVAGSGGQSELLFELWDRSRSGARSGRGFHFQDAVGAWLAAQMASARIAGHGLVPEGLEDMSVDGPSPLHVQVKSRVQHRGRFPVGEATQHILDAWEKHLSRGEDGSTLVVVFESGVRDEANLADLGQPLADSLSADSALRAVLRRAAGARGIDSDGMSRLLCSTVVVGATWEDVTARTVSELARTVTELDCPVDLPPSGLGLVARHLRTVVADAADANATADYEHRRRLSRSELVGEIEATVGMVDINALEFAVTEGICEPLDMSVSAPADDRFYEGTATQPHHVAAGLVVPQPAVMDKILFGLDERSAVVITGPSGVGKSAVLWTVPRALPGVLWYRVRRLADKDVPHLIRLADAYRATRETPVGFLVDAAGTDAVNGWARLRAEAAAVPGVLLVGTARSEDMITLGDLSGCATVTLRLDRAAAETIFRGLKRRGATQVAHWEEALTNSNGLTLEFTHMLTRGQRLREVLGEQVRRRIAEERYLELEVLSLISVADRWTVFIRTQDLADACGVADLELRSATTRLVQEHLIVEREGTMSGLHRLRSTAISGIIHDQPPPDLHTTIRKVLDLVPDSELHRFVANLLRDEPSARTTVTEAASSKPLRPSRFAGYLHGLRLADFYEVAKAWKRIADEHQIPASCQPLLLGFTAIGMSIPDLLPAELRAAQQEMNHVPGSSSRDQLVSTAGEAYLAELLASTDDIDEATQLLAVLENGPPGLADAVRQTIDDHSPLVDALRSAPIKQLAESLAVARSCDIATADHLVSLIGGEDAVLRRIRAENPWITELEVRADEEGPVAHGRFLHVSDTVQGDAREQAVALGQVLLRCLPRIESVDIQALAPGGIELTIGDFTHGVSHLQRRADYSVAGVAWNQARIRAALTLIGEADTERLAKAQPLLNRAAKLTHESCIYFITGKRHRLDSARLTRQINELHDAGRSLKPPLGAVELGDTAISEQGPALTNEPLSALILALTGNIFRRLTEPDQHRKLAAYLSNTVISGYIESARAEPWALLGIDGYPESLDRLHDVLSNLQAVVSELAANDADPASVFTSAKSGPARTALQRAARTSRHLQRRRIRSRRRELQTTCDTTGFTTKVMYRHESQTALTEFAITVELGFIAEWSDTSERLASALSAKQPTGEVYLLVPTRHGRPVPGLAMRLIDSLLPHTELGDWATRLPDPSPSEFTDAFDEAQNTLQTLSGIAALPNDQQTHPTVQDAVEEAESLYNKAYGRLLDLATDALADQLLSIIEATAIQVQAELDGEATGPGYAEQIATGYLQVAQTDEFHTLTVARLLALEWDINPAAATSILADL